MCFSQHSDKYDFFESNPMIDNSLTNVKSRFVFDTNGMAKIKCSFSQINIQPPMNEHDVLLISLRYRATEVCKIQHSDDFTNFSLRQDRKRRVIINVES